MVFFLFLKSVPLIVTVLYTFPQLKALKINGKNIGVHECRENALSKHTGGRNLSALRYPDCLKPTIQSRWYFSRFLFLNQHEVLLDWDALNVCSYTRTLKSHGISNKQMNRMLQYVGAIQHVIQYLDFQWNNSTDICILAKPNIFFFNKFQFSIGRFIFFRNALITVNMMKMIY